MSHKKYLSIMRDQSAVLHSAKDKRKSPKDVYLEKKGFFLGGTIGSGAYAKVKRGYDKVNKRDVGSFFYIQSRTFF